MAMFRLEPRARLLIAGDLAALVLFAVAGRRSHDEATGLAAIGSVAETALPFVLGWIAAVILLRTVRAPEATSVVTMLRQTAPGWAIALPIAILLRAALLGRFSPWTFYVVAFLVGFALLAAWRTIFVLGERWFASRAPAA